MRHNSATAGSDKVLTGDVLHSINGSTDDLDLELLKPGPYVLHVLRVKGSPTLDAPAPIWMRVWACQSRRLAIVTTCNTRRYNGRNFSQAMRNDEMSTWKAIMRCRSFPGGSFQDWVELIRPDWTGPVEALDIEARISQAASTSKMNGGSCGMVGSPTMQRHITSSAITININST